MMGAEDKKLARKKRKLRIRKKISGTPERPRLSIFRSARHVYAQIIDDIRGETIVAASSLEKVIREDAELKAAKGKIKLSLAVGKLIAQRAKEKGIQKIVFDRSGFLFHGRVKAISEGAREGGLDF